MSRRWIALCFALALTAVVAISPAAAQDGKPTKVPPTPGGQPTLAPVVTQEVQPNTTFVSNILQGQLLLQETFDSPNAWENYRDNRGVDMGVGNGVYRVHIPGTLPDSYIWALNNDLHTDVVITATATQPVQNDLSSYGLMCRADTSNNGLGYYFLVNGDGTGYIGIGEGDSVNLLTDVIASPAINLTGNNVIAALCAGGHLALYVNDTLIVEADDSTYSSGFAGIAASSGTSADTDVTFDDLAIAEAITGGIPAATPGVPAATPGASVSSLPFLTGVNLGAALLTETFDSPNAWEFFASDDNSLQVRVENGAYRASVTGTGTIWGLNETSHTDVVLDVQTAQLSAELNNGYGVMCRADPENDGDGYYFLISGDGYYAIARATGGFEGTIDRIVGWTPSDVIQQGQVSNQLTAVCVGSYLALYANGVKLAEITDTTFTSGLAGFAAVAFEKTGVDVTFDNLTIFSAAAL